MSVCSNCGSDDGASAASRGIERRTIHPTSYISLYGKVVPTHQDTVSAFAVPRGRELKRNAGSASSACSRLTRPCEHSAFPAPVQETCQSRRKGQRDGEIFVAAEMKLRFMAQTIGFRRSGKAKKCPASQPEIVTYGWLSVSGERSSLHLPCVTSSISCCVMSRILVCYFKGRTVGNVPVYACPVSCHVMLRILVCYSRGGQAYNLSRDHKLELSAERERIQKAGGFIHMGRVNGSLNLTRAIG
ncbi:hypothetical protein PR202_gb06415 [Eleusine coracana subsp. coracana]|uniref:protein-serine/threonine phosphatase n=1 Tax=Eleusine coracana subsp. coracana TaxID=191504 RepID=A0AAV5E8T9_ELECO|nr:hypothetical protein PR202_gb06415 [Eleusine coracana subsp. coracana]